MGPLITSLGARTRQEDCQKQHNVPKSGTFCCYGIALVKEVLHRVAEVGGHLRKFPPPSTFSMREMLIMKTRGRATPQSKAEDIAVILRGPSTSSLY